MSDPKYLNVGPLPFRKGNWLSVSHDGAVKALAKFRDEESMEIFLAVLRRAQKNGIEFND